MSAVEQHESQKKIVRSWESFRKSVVKHNETHQVDPFQTFTMELKSFFLGKNDPPACGQGAPEPQLACCTCGSVPTPGEARHRNATFHGYICRRTERINQIDIKKLVEISNSYSTLFTFRVSTKLATKQLYRIIFG